MYPQWARAAQERRSPAAAGSRFATLVTSKNERVPYHHSTLMLHVTRVTLVRCTVSSLPEVLCVSAMRMAVSWLG